MDTQDHKEEAQDSVNAPIAEQVAESSTSAEVPQVVDSDSIPERGSIKIHESAQQHLNVDSDDADSALGGMTSYSSTMSVQSSIYNYVEENGRTYHRYKEGKYMMPNDEAEKDRLDLQHHIWMLTLDDELMLSPIKNPKHVLDFGCGTGIWAIEFANRYPKAEVLGTDLSPIQPEFIPKNCSFQVDDAEDEWNYSQKFDLIHGRAMVTCFKDPLSIIKQAFKSLAPGGYLELQDMILPLRAIDDSLRGTSLDKWINLTMDAAAKIGTSWKLSANYTQYYKQAGFVDVVERHYQWPSNSWAKGKKMKVIGTFWQENALRGLESLSMAVLTRGAGMTKEEVLKMTAEVRKDLLNRSIHAYLPVVFVYGRKPE